MEGKDNVEKTFKDVKKKRIYTKRESRKKNNRKKEPKESIICSLDWKWKRMIKKENNVYKRNI